MKKIYSYALTLALMATSGVAFAYTGTGTEKDPYVLSTKEDLLKMHDLRVANKLIYVELGADIDLESAEWVPFCGEGAGTGDGGYVYWIGFDGKGHTIKNLVSNNEKENQNRYHSFFGVLGGYCKNVVFDGAKVVTPSTDMGAAVVASYLGHGNFTDFQTYIDNVMVTNSTVQSNAGVYAGAIAGTTGAKVSISNCHVYFTNVYSKGGSETYLGGIIGRVGNDLTVSQCVAGQGGVVNGDYYAGAGAEAATGSPAKVGGIIGGVRTGKTPTVSVDKCVVSFNTICGTLNTLGSNVSPFGYGLAADQVTNCVVNHYTGLYTSTTNGSTGYTGRSYLPTEYYPTTNKANYAQMDQIVGKCDGNWAGGSWTLNVAPRLAFVAAKEYFNGQGLGTEADPFVISDATSMANMYKVAKPGNFIYFKQDKDIDMSGTAYVSFNAAIGEYFSCGMYYDGQNHIIKNLTPSNTVSAKNVYYPSFAGILFGSLKNVGFENINATPSYNYFEHGPVAGYIGHNPSWTGTTTVENVFVTGTISAAAAQVGGMFGFHAGNVAIKNVRTTVKITNASGVKEGTAQYIGGLIGSTNYNGTISNAYTAVDIEANTGADSYAGALVGFARATTNVTVDNVIAWNGSISAKTAVSTTAASVADGAKCNISNFYVWEGMKLNGEAVTGGKTTYELQVIATGWDGWNKKVANGMPVLAWEEATEEVSGVNTVVAAEEGESVYYNLQGMKVAADNLTPGIYVRLNGNKAEKVLVK